MSEDSPRVTEVLNAWGDGEPQALDDLMTLVYTQLREMSRRALRNERNVQTLNPTALVHEVYLRLANLKKVKWENRRPFFGYAADLMYRAVVDHARALQAKKRAGWGERLDLEIDGLPGDRDAVDTLELSDVLSRLEAQDPFLAKIIKLRFFVGFNEEETAEALEVSRATVQREWRVGKRKLAQMLGKNLDE